MREEERERGRGGCKEVEEVGVREEEREIWI